MDCEWDEWEVGECSKSCGGGTRTNSRKRIVGGYGGKDCSGSSIVLENCNVQECPGKIYEENFPLN